MRRQAVRSFLEDGIILLTDVTYGSGRVTEWNSDRIRVYPMAWIESLRTSSDITSMELLYDTWSIKIHIAKKDTADSVEVRYEALIDDCDEMAQELIRYYNQVVSGYKLVTITGINREPFIKKNADCLTGVILSFDLTAPDTTNLC